MNDLEALLDKVLDAGANTIWGELNNLKGASPEEIAAASKRWIWELIQNASDCASKDKSVNIFINYNKAILEFAHDGEVFTYKNLLDLITQISSKQSSEEEKTGKFGTGFISTHLLSEKIVLNSFFSNGSGYCTPLEITLDRSGKTYEEIKLNIEKELSYIEELKTKALDLKEDEIARITRFNYDLKGSLDSQLAVDRGIDNLLETIPYLLSFNANIKSITYNGNCYRVKDIKEIGVYKVIEVVNSNNEEFHIIIFNKGKTEVAFKVRMGPQFEIDKLNKGVSKIFCKFPLVGTESFSFPLIINNPELDVLRDRNGIHEGADKNIQILEDAKEVYAYILNFVSKEGWKQLYNLCITPNNKQTKLNENLYDQIKNLFEYIPLIETNVNGVYCGLKKYKGDTESENVVIPYHENKELRDDLWVLANDIVKFPIPTFEEYKEWANILTSKIDLNDLNEKLLNGNKNMETLLQKYNKTQVELFDWLNKFYDLWDRSYYEIDKIEKVYVLNQNLEFKIANSIFKDANLDERLIEVLTELGTDIKNKLLSKDLIISENIIKEGLENKDIAKKIERLVDDILSEESVKDNKRDSETQIKFNKLTNWFIEYPEESKQLFEKLYNRRTLLSSLEQTIYRFKIAEKVESNNIEIEELDAIISNHKKISEILSNIGEITDVEILKELKHHSVSNIDYYRFFEEKYERSKERIYSYLKSNPKYEVPESIEIWENEKYSKTVFPAKKDNVEINIIIRPSDGDKIIIHDDAEFDVLDSRNYELWTDNGIDTPRDITLGDILKTTGMNVIPLRNIFEKY